MEDNKENKTIDRFEGVMDDVGDAIEEVMKINLTPTDLANHAMERREVQQNWEGNF